jgi:hypothetical protein
VRAALSAKASRIAAAGEEEPLSQYDPYNPPASANPAGDTAPQQWGQQEAPLGPSPSVQATMNQMTDRMQTVIDAAERAAEAIRHDAEEQARRHLAETQRKADRLTAERVGLISELTDDLIRHAANVRDHSEQMVRALEDAISSVTDKLEQPAMSDPLGAVPAPSTPLAAPPAGDEAHVPQPAPDPAAHGVYTDLVGTPPPPVPASAPAPVPPRMMPPDLPSPPTGALQPTPEDAAAAAAAADPGRPANPQPPASPGAQGGIATRREQPVSEDAVLHAGQLAAAGESRETIANALRQVWGVSDPDPIVDQVLGNR